MKRKTITLERSYEARLDEVWALWTTKEGFESWWGPDGFRAEVRSLDLKPGGELLYAMIASAPEQIAAMKKMGMPVSHDAKMIFKEVVPLERLAYTNVIDFVPGVAAYDVETVVEFLRKGSSVQMRITLDAMHEEEWTKRAVMGWEMQLEKLGKVLQP
jgi:uncharacterized protein YndB with AHSA1/START domain